MSKYSNEKLWQLWELRVEEMMELGISQSEYARRNDIPSSTLSYWVNKLKNNKTCTSSKAGNDMSLRMRQPGSLSSLMSARKIPGCGIILRQNR